MLRQSLAVGPLASTTTVVGCPDTHEAIVIDPGGDAGRIIDLLDRMKLRPVSIVHTHGHFDHIMGTRDLVAATSAPVAIHEADVALYRDLVLQARFFDFVAETPPEPTEILVGGEILRFGHYEARVLHTPGHTPGSVCLFIERTDSNPLLLSGDTLFAEGIGRTDFPGGSFPQIIASIRERLLSLPDNTVVVPGHGPETTIGEEREHNPYVGRRVLPRYR